MDLQPLPFRSPLRAYEEQAASLLAAHRAAAPAAIDLFHRRHPRFLDDKIKWLPKSIPVTEIRDAALSSDDARLALARFYDFFDWTSLAAHVDAVSRDGPIFTFEAAVEAVVNGDLAALEDALRRDPALVHARSTRVCCFDPPVHRATLLHYVAANGVEHFRQKTPANAVVIARALLDAGSEPDALADMYGAQCTIMEMLVSSGHPAQAGLQVPLIELLLDFGAAIEGRGSRKWGTPLHTALAFGMSDAAEVLARRGAHVDLPAAAGLGRVDDAIRLLPSASADARHRADVAFDWGARLHGKSRLQLDLNDRIAVDAAMRESVAQDALPPAERRYLKEWGAWNAYDPTVATEMCAVIEQQALPMLRGLKSIDDLIAFTSDQERFPWTSLGSNDFEEVFVYVATGNLECAQATSKRFTGRATTRQQLIELLATGDRRGAARLLHNWEAASVKRLKLENFWEPTPFPIEASA